MTKLAVLALTYALFVSTQAARAGNVIMGVNISNNDGTLSQEFQEEEIKQLVQSHVTTIRTGLAAFNIDFIIKAHQNGIGSIVLVALFLA